MKKLFITILMSVALASQLIAAPAGFVDNNAALRYLMAIGYMPPISEKASYRLGDVTDIKTLQALNPDYRKELEADSTGTNQISAIFQLLDLAAQCSHSTFFVDQNYNFDSMVPPYRTIRSFARFINARGWMDAEKGNYLAAAKKFVHVFRLGNHLSHEGLAITGMIGVALQRVAVVSIDNLLEISKDAAVKKLLLDYFASLPKPLIDSGLHVKSERLYIFNTLEMAEKKPGLFAIFEFFFDKGEDAAAEAKKSPELSCLANQRVLLGAMEMYLMDHEEAPVKIDTATIIDTLVQEQYLKAAPECEKKGKYAIKFVDAENFDVACSCGASLNDAPTADSINNSTESSSDSASESVIKEVSPELLKKINAYIESGSYAKDKKELAEMFDEIEKIDAYAAESDAKAGTIAERIEKSSNTLVKTALLNPQALFKSLRENQQRIDDLVKKLSQ